MKRTEATFPLPYFEIDANWNIRLYSSEAEEIFGLPLNLREVVEDETAKKAEEWVDPGYAKATFEMKLVKKNKDIISADVYITWKNNFVAELLLVPKDKQVEKVAKQLKSIQSELSKTKQELVEEKEWAENVTKQNNRLSAPFISLTEETALVPLFGDLTYDKIMNVEQNLLEEVCGRDPERLLFDFTGVGSIEEPGFECLAALMKALSHMGVDLTVIGLRPRHVPNIYKWALPPGVRFMQSLEQVVRNYLNEQQKLLEEKKN